MQACPLFPLRCIEVSLCALDHQGGALPGVGAGGLLAPAAAALEPAMPLVSSCAHARGVRSLQRAPQAPGGWRVSKFNNFKAVLLFLPITPLLEA